MTMPQRFSTRVSLQFLNAQDKVSLSTARIPGRLNPNINAPLVRLYATGLVVAFWVMVILCRSTR